MNAMQEDTAGEMEKLAEETAHKVCGSEPVCCGDFDTGGEYYGQREQLCCGTPNLREKTIEELTAVILSALNQAVQRERERAAVLCDKLADDIDMERVPDIRGETAANRLAAAIRKEPS